MHSSHSFAVCFSPQFSSLSFRYLCCQVNLSAAAQLASASTSFIFPGDLTSFPEPPANGYSWRLLQHQFSPVLLALPSQSFHAALQMDQARSSSLNILNQKDNKLKLNTLLQTKSVIPSHLDFPFLFDSSCMAAARTLTAVGSITLLMMCSGTDVVLCIYPSSPTFGAE